MLAGVLFVLALAWGAVFAVDVHGLSEIGAQQGAWWHLFRQGSPVEWIQWGFLSLLIWHGAYLCGIYRQQGNRPYSLFWGLLAVGFIFMLLEDAGDPRHVLAAYGHTLLGVPERYIEAPVFLLMVAPLFWAVLRYRQPLRDNPQILPYAALGTLLYALVASSSLLRVVGNLYVRIGRPLTEWLTGGAVPPYYLIDFVIQESMEALATALLFASVLVYLRSNRQELDRGLLISRGG